ncbi:MAG: hypothetical protein F4X78_11100 [Gammaproteobacteria bacterium]|nr:hypothetical protein [Gammaproteobacteria bacterium]
MTNVHTQDQQQFFQFFNGLNSKLEAAKEIDRQLDRHLGHRFNSFKYLNTYERGLSLIIADLLDPKQSHGQGSLFLDILLSKTEKFQNWTNLDTLNAKVRKEQPIPFMDSSKEFRFIDICVEIPSENGIHCIAFENKPEAGDRDDQIKDYLRYLEKEYQGRCLLIYLPPTGTLPEENSISKEELRIEIGKQRFVIMPYLSNSTSQDDDSEKSDAKAVTVSAADFSQSHASTIPLTWEDFEADCSLTEWLIACREKCQAERIRWFLNDATSYFQRRFGSTTMTSDTEIKAIREFLIENRGYTKVARNIYESFTKVNELVIEEYGKLLRPRVKVSLKSINNLKFSASTFARGNSKDILLLSIYSPRWKEYENGFDYTEKRMSICLGIWRDTLEFYWGIYSPCAKGKMTEGEKKDYDKIRSECMSPDSNLKFEKSDDLWLSWSDVKDEYRDGKISLFDLNKEIEEGGGEITRYLIENIVRITEEAVSILNSIDGMQLEV